MRRESFLYMGCDSPVCLVTIYSRWRACIRCYFARKREVAAFDAKEGGIALSRDSFSHSILNATRRMTSRKQDHLHHQYIIIVLGARGDSRRKCVDTRAVAPRVAASFCIANLWGSCTFAELPPCNSIS